MIAARRSQPFEEIEVAGASLVADVAGALYWPQERLLAVADLHLEKGSSFAARGSLLPPYDTADTLARLRRLIETYAPRCVIALGDSFHDRGGGNRLSDRDRAHLAALQRGRDWIWIAGNHDPAPIAGIAGRLPRRSRSGRCRSGTSRSPTGLMARSPGTSTRSRALA